MSWIMIGCPSTCPWVCEENKEGYIKSHMSFTIMVNVSHVLMGGGGYYSLLSSHCYAASSEKGHAGSYSMHTCIWCANYRAKNIESQQRLFIIQSIQCHPSSLAKSMVWTILQLKKSVVFKSVCDLPRDVHIRILQSLGCITNIWNTCNNGIWIDKDFRLMLNFHLQIFSSIVLVLQAVITCGWEMKVDIHSHILPETWPNLKEVSVWKFVSENGEKLLII